MAHEHDALKKSIELMFFLEKLNWLEMSVPPLLNGKTTAEVSKIVNGAIIARIFSAANKTSDR